MEISTLSIQAKFVLGRAQSGDYIDWAVNELAKGWDSKNLRILAGLEKASSPFEAEAYFLKARTELLLPEFTKDEAIRVYALHLAQQIILSEGNFETLVGMISELCYSNGYPKYLMVWYDLNDGLCDKRSGDYPYACEALYKTDSKSVVDAIAREFISREINNGEWPHIPLRMDSNVTLKLAAQVIKNLELKCRVKAVDANVSDWSPIIFQPVESHYEGKGFGPMPGKEIEWIDIDPVVVRWRGRLVPDLKKDKKQMLIAALSGQKIVFEDFGEFIRVNAVASNR